MSQKELCQQHFEVGDHVFLRVTMIIGIGKAIKAKKLHPRFIGQFEILSHVGTIVYRISLPPSLSHLYIVFHVSQLIKHIPNPLGHWIMNQYK